MGNERRPSSSRKGKSNSEKPKQPRRGLGVAQLERIRLYGQMGCTSLHASYPPNFNQVSAFPCLECLIDLMEKDWLCTHARRHESATSLFIFLWFPPQHDGSWNPSNGILDCSGHFAQPNLTRQLLDINHTEVAFYILGLQVEDDQAIDLAAHLQLVSKLTTCCSEKLIHFFQRDED
ncbi:hypothetical protein V6N11_061248 [Hibiscus sabdariffa]|uniref:C2H2-type domain-containing protein n=1 Tax=Hibiscus sabdariffa TaxID=183260 RepID=A0ABR2NVB4_9ROSI